MEEIDEGEVREKKMPRCPTRHLRTQDPASPRITSPRWKTKKNKKNQRNEETCLKWRSEDKEEAKTRWVTKS